MTKTEFNKLPQLLKRYENELLDEWIREQVKVFSSNFRIQIKEPELRNQCREFLTKFVEAAQSGNHTDIRSSEWLGMREFLTDLSHNRAMQGFSPSETGIFIFSLKRPLFALLGREFLQNADMLLDKLIVSSELLDRLGLYTFEVYQKGREEIINRQQQEMLEISTPVVSLWNGILALPMIGTLDSSRTQVVMETLLQKIVDTGSKIAIIDITGVPTVDTLVAQHLMKTVSAARLMGADCIISGIRPQIAQTIVHLAVDLGSITTKATLADAFALALQRIRQPIDKSISNKLPLPHQPQI